MEALIPKLFIITAEASIVLLLILIIMIIFNMKAKRKDLNAVNELVSNYTGSREERISVLKKQLKNIDFKGSIDEQAEKLFQNEKTMVKEFVTLYLRRDTYRLLDYPDNLIENNDSFLKTSGSAQAATVTQGADTEDSSSEETANATILAREQAESNEAHLKELSELRLKNTELNEHLFEALETITALMTEHGKKTGQEVESNAQKLLEAIIYLRDKRLVHDNDPSRLAPSANDNHDKIASLTPATDEDSSAVDLASINDTLDDSTAVHLGISDELNMDLDSLIEDETITEQAENNNPDESTSINIDNSSEVTDTTESIAEDDPWADALAEQATAEAETAAPAETDKSEVTEEDDPWADALAEQATAEAEAAAPAETDETEVTEEDDPWADALAEQATAEAETAAPAETGETEVTEEDDPWADALAEQATAEAEAAAPAETGETEVTEEDDPWAEALAEQEQSEKK